MISEENTQMADKYIKCLIALTIIEIQIKTIMRCWLIYFKITSSKNKNSKLQILAIMWRNWNLCAFLWGCEIWYLLWKIMCCFLIHEYRITTWWLPQNYHISSISWYILKLLIQRIHTGIHTWSLILELFTKLKR